MLLDDSFSNMITVIERVESKANLSEDEINQLKAYKSDIQDKKAELNGKNDFDKVQNESFDDFSEYSQQFFEQADRTVTIGLTAALLIIIIILLL